jgi:type I restriction enzyme S subunit
MDATTAALFPAEFEESALGLIPKGWCVTQLCKIAELVKGRSYKSSELADSETALVTLKSFERGGGFREDGFKSYQGSFKPEQVVAPGECVIALTDVTQQAEVIGRAALVTASPNHNMLVASLDVGVLRPIAEGITGAFLYFLCRGERYVQHVLGYTSGTTVLHLAKEGVECFPLPMPPSEVAISYSALTEPLLQRITHNKLAAKVLVDLRNTLLPRLFSGKLRPPEAELKEVLA